MENDKYYPVPTTINLGIILNNNTGFFNESIDIEILSPKIRIETDDKKWKRFTNENHSNSITFNN